MKILKLLCAGLLTLALAAAPTFAMEHTIGLGAGMVPDYEGSDDYQTVPMLMLKGKYDSGRSFSLVGTNLKVNLVPSRTFQLGPVLNYRMGRDDVDNDRVDDMKDIDDAFELGAYGSVDIDSWLLGAEFLADVSGEHDGMLGTLSVGYRWKAAPVLTVLPRLFTTYADGSYMNTYFGVNSGNRGTSGLPNYDPDSGFKDIGLNVVVDYTPWDHWGISGVLGYSVLLSEAKDSPIVDDEGDDQQLYFGLMGTYRWGN